VPCPRSTLPCSPSLTRRASRARTATQYERHVASVAAGEASPPSVEELREYAAKLDVCASERT